MKIILLSLILFLLNTKSTSADVYICISKTAHKYHYDASCKGLKQCTHKIKKVTLKEASLLGYKMCGWED